MIYASSTKAVAKLEDMWRLHFNCAHCVIYFFILLYLQCCQRTQAGDISAWCGYRRRIRDTYTTWRHFQKADLIWVQGLFAHHAADIFQKKPCVFFLQDLEENVPGCSRCTILFVEQRSEGVGLDGRRNYGPLMLHWEGSCIFKWLRLKVGTLAVICANQASSVTCH